MTYYTRAARVCGWSIRVRAGELRVVPSLRSLAIGADRCFASLEDLMRPSGMRAA
ncbi:MAG: hypothetical protein WBG11_04815 [Methylocella sp.]